MSAKTEIISNIESNVSTNGTGNISGLSLQNVLKGMINNGMFYDSGTGTGSVVRTVGVEIPSTALGEQSYAEGYNCKTGGTDDYNSLTPSESSSAGLMAHAEGNSTIAKGANSHAEGKKTFANGVAAHAEGYNTFVNATAGHAEGQSTQATGSLSHVEGYHTSAQNYAEHAQGYYNKSNKASTTFGDAGNTHHSIGVGNSTTPRNAIEVMQNGEIYIIGLGGYDGTNAGVSGVKSLQVLLAELDGITYVPVTITG